MLQYIITCNALRTFHVYMTSQEPSRILLPLAGCAFAHVHMQWLLEILPCSQLKPIYSAENFGVTLYLICIKTGLVVFLKLTVSIHRANTEAIPLQSRF